MSAPSFGLPDQDRPFAVVDIGSNSGRMIVFRLRDDEHLDVLEDARAPLRLARELRDDDQLGESAIERTLEALRDFAAVAGGAGASRFIAVATSAVRDAADGPILLERARAIGIPLEEIDGVTEARLGFLGAVHDLPVRSGLTMDVGGGSIDLSRFVGRAPGTSWTLPFGSLRVSDRYLRSDPPSTSELRSMRTATGTALREAAVERLDDEEDLVGIGGTIRNLAKIDLRAQDAPLPLLHGYVLPSQRLDEIVADLAERPMRRRALVPGLNPDRADTIVGGGLVVLETMRHVGASQLTVSSRGLREGLALDAFGRPAPPARFVRSISVATLAARFATWDPDAAERRATIALRLHEALDPEAAMWIREMLEHAARIVDVGRAIDYYDRFQHAAQIVVAADLGGFSHRDLAGLATILRRAADDGRAGPYLELVGERDRPAVERAAATLWLAEELRRRIPPLAPAIPAVGWTRGAFEVVAAVPAAWRPRAVASRFEEEFSRPLVIVSAAIPVG